MASINRETPFFVMVVSSSLTTSSKVKPYWKPEQPPPCTNTRSLRSGLPSSATNSATLAAALSVKTSGAGMSVWMFSATALMGCPDIGLEPFPGGFLNTAGGRHSSTSDAML
ncbi:hypothetical protein D9M68_838320 [compost metagenome]